MQPWKCQAGSKEQESADAPAGKNGRFGLTGGTPSRAVCGLRGRPGPFPVTRPIPIPLPSRSRFPPAPVLEQPRHRRARAPPGGSSGQGNPAAAVRGRRERSGPRDPKHRPGNRSWRDRVCLCVSVLPDASHNTGAECPRRVSNYVFAQPHLSLCNRPKFPPKNSCPGVVAWLESLGQSPHTVTESLRWERPPGSFESSL